MKKDFCYLFRVRYAECDAQQVVFNAKYVEYIDVAITELFRAIWGDYQNIIDRGMDTQVVNVNVSWKAPAHFDEVIAAYMRHKRIGNTSFTIQVDFFNYQKGHQIAMGEITYVMVSHKEHQKMKVPDDFRADLEKGAPGVIINHAGVELRPV